MGARLFYKEKATVRFSAGVRAGLRVMAARSVRGGEVEVRFLQPRPDFSAGLAEKAGAWLPTRIEGSITPTPL